jgi:hypothetical protein
MKTEPKTTQKKRAEAASTVLETISLGELGAVEKREKHRK